MTRFLRRSYESSVLVSILVWTWSLLYVQLTAAKVACTTSEFCQDFLAEGSQCVDGYCDNPYQYGCLRSKLDSFEKLRVCHSEDPPGAADAGLCRDVSNGMLDYPEVRIMSQNWESPFFDAWILQILLSEVLDVPTTIETGDPDVNVNFYNPESRFEYGVAYDMEGIERASNIHDCREVEQIQGEPYKSCGHAILEIWSGQDDVINRLLSIDAAEPKTFIGMIGEEGWQVPKYTSQKEPSIMSWFGMTGNENRRKLADLFLRPTKWGDYCDEVSIDGCTSGNDTVAVRAPENEVERNSFFVENLYTGHFRKTEENDCDRWPANCTGHFLDYPCGWSSFFVGQAHHLNIGLKSNGDEPGANGYSYTHMLQVWNAANWTKSDVIGWWWRPEALYQKYQGTDFELQRVGLPPTNHECIDNRLNIDERCGPDDTLRIGNRDGTCDIPPIPNYKLLSTGLHRLINNPDIPDPLRSPAYEVMRDFTIDGFDLGKIFAQWLDLKKDTYGFDPREAVCEWVSEHFQELQRIIPASHPRVVEETEEGAFTWTAIGFGCIAFLGTLICIALTYRQRERRVFQFAQIEFVFLLLIGMLCVSAAAIVAAIPPTDSSCLATLWLLNIGYCLELVPLVVKIAAINQLMQAAKKMKRIKLNRSFLFGAVAFLTGVIVLFLVFWSVFDPPSKQGTYTMDGTLRNNQYTVVAVSYFCESDSIGWTIFAVGAQAFLLLCASILAFLTRKMTQDVNEATTISILIYWNFVCVLLRIVLLMLQDSIDVSILRLSLSLILSTDSLATILIYFLPKFFGKQKRERNVSIYSFNVGLPSMFQDDEFMNNSSRRSDNGAPTPYQGNSASKVSFAEQAETKKTPSCDDDDPSSLSDSIRKTLDLKPSSILRNKAESEQTPDTHDKASQDDDDDDDSLSDHFHVNM